MLSHWVEKEVVCGRKEGLEVGVVVLARAGQAFVPGSELSFSWANTVCVIFTPLAISQTFRSAENPSCTGQEIDVAERNKTRRRDNREGEVLAASFQQAAKWSHENGVHSLEP